MWRILSVEQVEARMHERERVLEPHVDERVVFGTHFTLGFGLPASRFLRQFMDFSGLQMHHLGYLGFCPFPSLFLLFFRFHAQKNGGGVVV
ncbi:hypothetical protein D1007_07613 [Hordeum vulgare]|nr:hypothetical protein D1007_07613 [Hordeum vulgare]